jgi:CDP-4-dehydro-6-deoxyglucose reductase
MSFQITIRPSNHIFTAEVDETILNAAIRAGFTLPYGCRNGACGSCKGHVLDGKLDYGHHQPETLTEAEKTEGKALFCCGKPLTDLVIEAREVRLTGEIHVRKLPCRVQKIEKVAPDVAVLYLKLPQNERMQFMAGQYIDFLLKDGKRRSFSMANAPHDDEFLQLHVRHISGGNFSNYVFTEMQEKTILRFEGPLGTFFLREDSDKPIVFMAGGTGFAPIKAIIEHALHNKLDRTMILYWGARSLTDLYMPHLPAKWQAENSNVTFIPVLSDPKPEDNWTGRTGLVHQAILDDFDDLSGFQVYACGAPIMCEVGHKAFTTQRRLPEEEFYSDAFTFSAEALAKTEV